VIRRVRPWLPALAVLSLAALTACSTSAVVPDTSPAPTPTPSRGSAAKPPETCEDGKRRSASYAPLPLTDRTGLLGEIVKRGRLVVGVSADSYLLGALKPGSVDQFEGFDIDVAREVAFNLLGSRDKVTFKVVTAADRAGAVNAGATSNGVDLVARAYTMTCARWKDVNFSAAYFQAAQDTLVPKIAPEASLAQLGAKKKVVCAPSGSTSLDALRRLAPGAVPYAADQHTACLALLQQGQVDAITGDNTVLAGLNAQDRATKVLKETLSSEPYGLASAKAHPELVQYVNSVLRRMEGDGTWQRLYDKYFATPLGPKKPPALDTSKPLPS
jgi:polar amino acid transport system substrate-binding protein